MRKTKGSWFIAALAMTAMASLVGISAARSRAAAISTQRTSSVSRVPTPALARTVARLAAEARAVTMKD